VPTFSKEMVAGVEPDKRAAGRGHVMLPLLGSVHSQYTKRPLTALNHRYLQRGYVSNTSGLRDYQR